MTYGMCSLMSDNGECSACKLIVMEIKKLGSGILPTDLWVCVQYIQSKNDDDDDDDDDELHIFTNIMQLNCHRLLLLLHYLQLFCPLFLI